MAPNRKSLTALSAQCMSLAELEGLQSTLVNSKAATAFLPLTHPNEEAVTAASTTSSTANDTTHESESVSYWEWSASVETEPVCDVLSTSNIVSNLIQSSISCPEEEQRQTLSETDVYWAEEGQDQEQQTVASSAPQHESTVYWEWPSTDEPAMKSKSYWTWESPTERTAADSYWAWETSCHEVAALVLATNAMHKLHLQQQQQQPVSESEQYWNWNGHPSDHYWDMPSTPALTATTGSQGYWEW